MNRTVFMIALTAILLLGGILLQIFLSGKNNKYLGLILPAVMFIYSLVIIVGLAAYAGLKDGETIGIVTATFLVSNIPTIILLGIYFGCREKAKHLSQLEKMNIQDLE